MVRRLLLGAALALALLGTARAEDAKELPALEFDEINTPLVQVVAKATAAKKPIFIDFFLDG